MVNFSFPKRELAFLALVLAVSLVVRFLLFPQQGYPIDTNCFISWITTASNQGIRSFYEVAGFADYPPFNVYIFWLFGSLANGLGITVENIIKWVPNLFDLATATLIYYFVRSKASLKIALLATALYAFNPAVIFNAAVWGQFDAVYTFFLILSLLLALKTKPELSAVSFALGILTKPQGIALAPLLIFLIFKKSGVKRLLYSVAAFAATVFVVILPFQWPNNNPVTFLSNIYFGAYGGYAYTSINAFNLWGMFGMWIPDGGLYLVGWGLFGAAAAFTLYVFHKQYKFSGDYIAIFAAFMLFFSFFMLPTRIHERYMFPAIATLALMFPFLKRTRLLYAVLTGTLFVNEAYVLYQLNLYYPNAPNLTGDPIVVAVSVINLLMLMYASISMWFELKGQGWLKPEHPDPTPLSQTPEKGEPPSTLT